MFSLKEEQRKFEKWAFGSTPVSYRIREMHAWNSRHGDKLWLEPSDCVETSLIKMFRIYREQIEKKEEKMDKKMHKITKNMETAEKDIKKGKKKEAVKVLKKAEKKNEKLVKIDKEVRDPIIKKVKKYKINLPEGFGKIK